MAGDGFDRIRIAILLGATAVPLLIGGVVGYVGAKTYHYFAYDHIARPATVQEQYVREIAFEKKESEKGKKLYVTINNEQYELRYDENRNPVFVKE